MFELESFYENNVNNIPDLCDCIREAEYVVVLLLGIFRRALRHAAIGAPLCPFTPRGRPAPKRKKFMIAAPPGSHLSCLRCVKTYGKTFYWP
jgi:hypothetical protein